MAQLRNSITQLIALGFGIRSLQNRYPEIDPGQDGYAAGQNGDAYTALGVNARPEGLRTGQLGTAVWDTFELQRPDLEAGAGSILLPDATLVSFMRSKTIVKTPVQGRDGTVKELISLDDWMISVKAVAVNTERLEYPHAYISRLLEVLNYAGALRVSSPHFANKGIQQVVVERVELPQVEGYPSLAPISLELSSDVPLELEIRNGE